MILVATFCHLGLVVQTYNDESSEIKTQFGTLLMDTVSTLFKPFSMGKLELKNRVVMAPMTRNFSPKNIPGDNVVDYYRRRAEGGVGFDYH